jgi:hypothetical protein
MTLVVLGVAFLISGILTWRKSKIFAVVLVMVGVALLAASD